MAKHTKVLYIATISNFVVIFLVFVFCFQNWSLDVEGLCEECLGSNMTRGLIFACLISNIGQVFAAMFMCLSLRNFNKKYGYGNLWIVFLDIFIILSLIQQIIWDKLFDIDVSMAHSMPSTARERLIVEMVDIQLDVLAVMNVIMLVYNIVLLCIVRYWYVKERKLLLEYLND